MPGGGFPGQKVARRFSQRFNLSLHGRLPLGGCPEKDDLGQMPGKATREAARKKKKTRMSGGGFPGQKVAWRFSQRFKLRLHWKLTIGGCPEKDELGRKPGEDATGGCPGEAGLEEAGRRRLARGRCPRGCPY